MKQSICIDTSIVGWYYSCKENKFFKREKSYNVIIAPITNTSKPYPTRVAIKSMKTQGWIVLDQIRTIDSQRIIKRLGALTDKEWIKVKAVLKETFVD
ncbi:MAG: type II toxin-antitoxin system PemK/MazF family toxin [Ginsengibacter sp.]